MPDWGLRLPGIYVPGLVAPDDNYQELTGSGTPRRVPLGVPDGETSRHRGIC